MSKKAGNFLWRRMRITLPAGTGGGEGPVFPSRTDVDTGITQLQKGFNNDSLGEPGFDIGGVGDPTRLQVVPMAPMTAWNSVTMDDPNWDLTTETMHVADRTRRSRHVQRNVISGVATTR
jgi:hypothetical protein